MQDLDMLKSINLLGRQLDCLYREDIPRATERYRNSASRYKELESKAYVLSMETNNLESRFVNGDTSTWEHTSWYQQLKVERDYLQAKFYAQCSEDQKNEDKEARTIVAANSEHATLVEETFGTFEAKGQGVDSTRVNDCLALESLTVDTLANAPDVSIAQYYLSKIADLEHNLAESKKREAHTRKSESKVKKFYQRKKEDFLRDHEHRQQIKERDHQQHIAELESKIEELKSSLFIESEEKRELLEENTDIRKTNRRLGGVEGYTRRATLIRKAGMQHDMGVPSIPQGHHLVNAHARKNPGHSGGR